MATIQDIISKVKSYNRKSDTKLIMRAYEYADALHAGQKRKSDEPYIIHPLEVAYIVSTLELDDNAICAALLHDVVEDTSATLDDIKNEFGEEIAMLVDGVTKLGKIANYIDKEEEQVENYRKFFMAMAKDIRVVMIKLADRLHNMRTLKHLSDDRKVAIAKETRQLYAPLANRLGIYSIKWELEDLSLLYLEPDVYKELVEGINSKRAEREAFINDIIIEIRKKLKEVKIEAEVYGRPKHLYSIYRKMQKDNKTLDQIYDLFAMRIIVNSVKDCYAALGLVHELYKPMPGRFKDYIAVPKPNMYQSLHTTLIGKNGTPFEIQIRTWDMHRVAEYGIAAHWAYKEGKNISASDEKLSWLRETLEWQRETNDDRDFMNKLKFDLFDEDVFVFTPKGDIKALPAGSIPIDLAYSIHEQIGNRMVGAKINNKMVPITTPLRNGDIVEIITRLLEEYKKEHKEEEIEKKIDELRETKKIDRSKVSKTGVIVKGIDNCLVKLSRCCNPLPGDEIIGYITKGRGVSVHRADCVNCKELLTDEQRLIDVSWYKENNASYVTELEVYANDRAGLLADITVAVGELKAKIVSINAKTVQNNRVAIINIGVEVENIDMLNKVIKTVRKVDSVYDVHRQK